MIGRHYVSFIEICWSQLGVKSSVKLMLNLSRLTPTFDPFVSAHNHLLIVIIIINHYYYC